LAFGRDWSNRGIATVDALQAKAKSTQQANIDWIKFRSIRSSLNYLKRRP
jgi:hypothetical protein